MDKNKVQFNLKNVHYAVLKNEEDGTIKWDNPVAVPGAVTLTLDPKGSVEPFYADGVVYYQSVANNGYSGDLEVARIHDQMLQDIWKFEIDSNKVIIEDANQEPNAFALLYQIDGDANNDFYCLYNCTGTRPGIGGTTNTETKTPQTKKSTISAVPLANGRVMARTTSTTTEEVKTNWFKNVYQKAEQVTETVADENAEQTTGEE